MLGLMEGGVFDDALESGRMGGTVSFDSQGVSLTQHDGTRAWSIGWHEVAVTEGGASGKMLFFRHRETGVMIFTEAKGALEAAEQAAGAGYEAIWAEVRAHASKRRFSEGGLWGLLIASVVLGIWGLFWLADDGVDFAVDKLPTSVDRTLGDSARDSLSDFGEPVKDEEVRALCMAIFDALKVHAPQDQGFEYRLEVLENEMPNAFAMPGGQMVILTGLLEILDTPEEVAGVLAHELAHVYRRHSLKRLLQATGLITLGQIAMGDVAGAAGMLAGAAGMAALQHYSREAEEDADRQGTELMHRAGIDPENLAEAFRKLQVHQDAMLTQSASKDEASDKTNDEESDEGKVADPLKEEAEAAAAPTDEGGTEAGEDAFDLAETIGNWMSSHPELESRVKLVRGHAATLGPIEEPFTFDLDWSVVTRMKEAEPTMEEEATP